MDGGWSYRKLHTIAGSPDGELTNYQVRFVVHRTDGDDDGEDVYIGTNCNEDYSDLRFTSLDNIPMSYWIEEIGTDYAVVWAKVPSIPTSGIQMYLYYGNAGAESLSNGDETFIFFDGFDADSLDTNKWTASGGSTTVSGGICTVEYSGSNAYLTSYDAWNTGIILRTRIKSAHYQTTTYQEFIGLRDNPNNRQTGGAYFSDPTTGKKYGCVDASGYTITDMDGWSADTWGVIEIEAADSSAKFRVNDNNEKTISTHYYTGSTPICVRARTANGAKVEMDWVLIRKCAGVAPSHQVWEADEFNPTPPVADFTADTVSDQPPLTVQFTDTSTGSPTAWDWDFGDGADNSTDQNPSHTYETEGSYSVSLTVINDYGTDSIKKKY